MLRDLILFLLRLAMWPVQRYFERHLVLRLDFGSKPPPPPDYTPVAKASKEAAEIAAQLGREQLNEARWQYDQNMAVARPVIETQLGLMQDALVQGRDYYEYGKTFRPLEQKMLRQTMGELTPAQIVRLGVSGLRLPSLEGRAQSANVIAGAGQSSSQWQQATQQQNQQPSQQPAQQSTPLLRFATAAQSGPQQGARFPGSGVLPYLGSQQIGQMLGQQGDDSQYQAPATSRPTPIVLPPLGQRPPTPDPTLTSQFDSLKTDMLKAIDERLKQEKRAGQQLPQRSVVRLGRS